MIIAVPLAARHGAVTVAATPTTVTALTALGHEVLVERGAGARSSFIDASYEQAGARLVDAEAAWSAEIVVTVHQLAVDDVAKLQPGALVVARMAPQHNPELIAALAARGITALALDAVPRISRAQSLDVLSTASSIAGYRAVIEAAEAYAGMFGGQVTAAGKTAPATVFVIGAGVAGLAAIGAAASLGARVRAFDVRPEAAEQIASMGGTSVEAPHAQQQIAADGYALPLTTQQQAAAMDVYARESAQADIVITTALVGGRAPITVTHEMVAAMRPGSVIVDLAAAGGGNCEATVPDDRIVTEGSVTILGEVDFTARMARHTSEHLSNNIVNLLTLLTPERDGALTIDLDDVVVRGMTIAHGGDVLWPPPPVQVSMPTAATPAPAPPPPEPAAPPRARWWWVALAGMLLALSLVLAPPAFLGHMTVFVLAVVIGFSVITQVSHSLHTPLMSQTNAISGIIAVGALLQLGHPDLLVTALAFAAASVASINIFGGFAVTYRMLGMFSARA